MNVTIAIAIPISISITVPVPISLIDLIPVQILANLNHIPFLPVRHKATIEAWNVMVRFLQPSG